MIEGITPGALMFAQLDTGISTTPGEFPNANFSECSAECTVTANETGSLVLVSNAYGNNEGRITGNFGVTVTPGRAAEVAQPTAAATAPTTTPAPTAAPTIDNNNPEISAEQAAQQQYDVILGSTVGLFAANGDKETPYSDLASLQSLAEGSTNLRIFFDPNFETPVTPEEAATAISSPRGLQLTDGKGVVHSYSIIISANENFEGSAASYVVFAEVDPTTRRVKDGTLRASFADIDLSQNPDYLTNVLNRDAGNFLDAYSTSYKNIIDKSWTDFKALNNGDAPKHIVLTGNGNGAIFAAWTAASFSKGEQPRIVNGVPEDKYDIILNLIDAINPEEILVSAAEDFSFFPLGDPCEKGVVNCGVKVNSYDVPGSLHYQATTTVKGTRAKATHYDVDIPNESLPPQAKTAEELLALLRTGNGPAFVAQLAAQMNNTSIDHSPVALPGQELPAKTSVLTSRGEGQGINNPLDILTAPCADVEQFLRDAGLSDTLISNLTCTEPQAYKGRFQEIDSAQIAAALPRTPDSEKTPLERLQAQRFWNAQHPQQGGGIA